MRRFVWLSTDTALMICHSLANACHNGKPGDRIHQTCTECERCKAGDRCGRMASLASHVIRETRTGKKIAVRLR